MLAFRQKGDVPAELPDPAAETLGLLRDKEMLRLGTLPDRRPLDVSLAIIMLTGLLLGASGSGKTRFLLSLILAALKWSLGLKPAEGTGPERLIVHDEVSDTKGETIDETKKHLAALYLESGDEFREKLARSVRLLEWSRDAVSPSAPFDNASGATSDAFLADLRTSIEIAVSSQTYTDSVRQALFMLRRLLIAKRFPPNYRYCQRLLSDPAFRIRQLDGVSDPDVRAYFAQLDDILPRQTAEALLRRIQHGLSFPEIKLSIGMPPAVLDRLLPKADPLLTLGNFGPGMRLPPSKAREQASQRIVDYLLDAPRRGGSGYRRLVIEEAAAFLTTAGELIEPLANAARTLRSFKTGIVYVAQDFENALPKSLVETVTLNSSWWAMFQSRREGEWIAPYAVDAEEGAKGRAAFVEHVRALPRQHLYFYAKRGKALYARALDVVAPEERTGKSADELREIFQTKIAVHSLIPVAVAQSAIEQWEAEVVDQPAAPSPTSRPKRRPPKGIADLLTDMEDADA
ncbi:MAG: hypothetical protein L6R30_06510 [Thermoanaerobaculia bacterium]|nr:hypothetical protein [Thermoanaerobaculia bacterium]